jgi:hypothetical protein
MWFGMTWMTVKGTAPTSSQEVLKRLRARFLALGGTVEAEQGDTLIGIGQAHAILGRSYLFGAWYGKVPLRLRLHAASEAEGHNSIVRVDCDLRAVLRRFLYVFVGLSVAVMVPLAIQGWRHDPSLLFLLLFPCVICAGNLLSLRMVLPQKLRQAFQVEGLWWES